MVQISNKFFLQIMVVLITICVSNVSYSYTTSEHDNISLEAKEFALFNAKKVSETARKAQNEKLFINYLKQEVPNIVAIKYMALWVLGNNRSKFTSEQLESFVNIFHNHLTEFYGAILYQSRDKNYTFKCAKSTGVNTAVVEFIVDLDKQKFYIDWQVRKSIKENKWLITDFIVNGISFLKAKRTEYNALFHKANNNPETFLKLTSQEIKPSNNVSTK